VKLKSPRFSGRFRAWKGDRICTTGSKVVGNGLSRVRDQEEEHGEEKEEARLKLKEGSPSGCSQETKVQVIEAWSSATVVHG
jgi:hypothetical protein